MQGSFFLPQRLSLQSLAARQSYRTFRPRSVGFCNLPRWQALELEKPGGQHGIANDLSPLQTLTEKRIVAFVGRTGNTSMRSTSFASIPSCSYKTELSRSVFNWTISASGKSCGSVQKASCRIPKPVQRHPGLQWLSLHTQREYATKPVVRVAGKTGGQEVHVKNEEFEFKRIVSESDSITTFYSSDVSSCSEDEEDEKKTKAASAYAEDSDSESSNDGEKGKDHKEAEKVKSLQQTENSKVEMRGLEKFEDSDRESEDEKEKILTKEEKKISKAELKQKEKLEKERMKAMKTMKKDEKKRKEVKKLDCEGKKDDQSDKEGQQNSRGETKPQTKLKAGSDLASDSEYEEEDNGVTDFGDDDLEKDEGNLVITEDEIEAYVEEVDISNKIEEEVDDIDEDDGFWDDDEGDVVVGDGGTGGGVVLGGTEWGTKALDLAEQVVAECGKDLSIFAFKVSSDRVIRVRLDKLSDRYGSPTMTDIENVSRKLSSVLEESGEAGVLPKDIDVEVSSPGAERVVRVPDDLERFKELPMYVQYRESETDQDGVLELDSVDMDAGLSVWKIANVKLNREVKGRGRPLNNKQKKWRATVPFESLKQVRLYLDL